MPTGSTAAFKALLAVWAEQWMNLKRDNQTRDALRPVLTYTSNPADSEASATSTPLATQVVAFSTAKGVPAIPGISEEVFQSCFEKLSRWHTDGQLEPALREASKILSAGRSVLVATTPDGVTTCQELGIEQEEAYKAHASTHFMWRSQSFNIGSAGNTNPVSSVAVFAHLPAH